MYYQLFLLFISFCAYAADVAPIDATQPAAHITCQNIEGIDNIIYTHGDTTVTFPAEILRKSAVLHDIITNCSDAKEDQAFKEAARWLIDDIDPANLKVFFQILQLPQQEFDAKIKSSVYLSIEQTKSLLALSNKFDIKSIYDPLVAHIAEHQGLWAYMPDDDTSYDIIQKIDPDYLCKLQSFLYTQRHYETSHYPYKKEIWGHFGDLSSTCQSLIKQHIANTILDTPNIKINPINPKELFVYDDALFSTNRTCLILNQDTNEYYTFQAPWNKFKAKYSSDGKKIEFSHKRSINYAFKSIYIFDTAAKKALFKGHGKANCNKNIVYGLASSDSEYKFHFLDTQETCTPWPQPHHYIKFSPNEKIFAIINWPYIKFYDIERMKSHDLCDLSPLQTLIIFRHGKVVYNSNGSELLIIHALRQITLYDGNTLIPLGTILPTEGNTYNASFTDNDKKIIIKYSEPGASFYSHAAYHHINIRQLSLAYIGELAKAFELDWKDGRPYRIESEQQLTRFHEMIPELLTDSKLFTASPASQKSFPKIVKENLEDTLGQDAQYFDTTNASPKTLQLWHNAQQYWQENDMKPYNLNSQELLAHLNSNLPLEVALKLFNLDQIYDDDQTLDKQLLKYALINIQSLNLQLNQTLLEQALDKYNRGTLSYFIMAIKHIKKNDPPYKIYNKHACSFLKIKDILHDVPSLQRLFDQGKFFDYHMVSKYTYKNNLILKLRMSRMLSVDKNIDKLNLTKLNIQFLCKAHTTAWKNKNQYLLETQEDLDHCFAFNQKLNKEQHAPIAQELRANNLFALSENVTENIREQFQGKIYQRLRAKQVMRRNQLHLLKNLSIDQLNMLFNASYKPYQLKNEELETYSQLPITFRREKLFGQNIFNETKYALRRELQATRPSRLADSFANIAYNVKKLMSN